MFASVARCTNVSITQSGSKSGSTGISNTRSSAFDFQQTGYTLQSNRTTNKWDIGTFMLTQHSLTLKEWSKVKSDTPKRFAADDLLHVDCTLQTSSQEPIISEIEALLC